MTQETDNPYEPQIAELSLSNGSKVGSKRLLLAKIAATVLLLLQGIPSFCVGLYIAFVGSIFWNDDKTKGWGILILIVAFVLTIGGALLIVAARVIWRELYKLAIALAVSGVLVTYSPVLVLQLMVLLG